MDAKLESIQSTGHFRDEFVTDLRSSNLNSRKEDSSDDSSTRAVVPSSCRELSLIGHSLDGLYLVQNRETKKVETIYCNFGTPISRFHIDIENEYYSKLC